MIDITNLPKPVEMAYDKYEPSTGVGYPVPILLLHGLYSCKAHWKTTPHELAEQSKRTVYIFDMRDMGESQWTEQITFKAVISDVINFMNKKNINKGIMIGHSLGGIIFAQLATLYPQLVEKLVLLDIHPCNKFPDSSPVTIQTERLQKMRETLLNEKIADLEAGKRRAMKLYGSLYEDKAILNEFLANLTVRDGQVDWKFNLENLAQLVYNLNDLQFETIPSYNGPALEIYGGKSDYFWPEYFESIRGMLPNIKFECIEEVDHALQLTRPTEFLTIVLPFINS